MPRGRRLIIPLRYGGGHQQGEEAVIVWEWVRPREQNLWYEEMGNKLVLCVLGKRGLPR